MADEAAVHSEIQNIPTKSPLNRRSLGFARDDKGEGGTSIGERLLNT